MTRLAIVAATLCVLIAGPAAAASDVQMLEMVLAAADKADQPAPNTVYQGTSVKATCRYRHAVIDPNSPLPPIVIQFYRNPPAGGFVNFTAHQACPATSPQTACVADTLVTPATPGALTVWCQVMQKSGYNLSDANPGNNKAEATINVVSRPLTAKPAAPIASGGWAATSAPSGTVKSCRTSLSAAVNVDPQQFVHPSYGPADLAQTGISLHLQKSQAAGNNITCHYATQGKDVPNLVVTIKCPNAAPRSGQPHSYGCTQ